MEIKWQGGTSLQFSSNIPKLVGEALQRSHGTLLEAIVIDAKPSGDAIELTLELASLQKHLKIQVNQNLPIGTRLALTLDNNDQPQTISIIKQPPIPSETTLRIATAHLRESLPLTTPLLPSLEKLFALVKSGDTALPPPVQSAITELMSKIPSTATVSSPEGLREAILKSGAVLEHTLISEESDAVEGDIKAQLMRTLGIALASLANPEMDSGYKAIPTELPPLANILKLFSAFQKPEGATYLDEATLPALKEAITQLVGSLSNIQSRQLSPHLATNAPDINSLVFAVELPVRGENSFHSVNISIEREPERNEQSALQRAWVLTMQIDMQQLGPLHARIVYRAQQISTTIWAQQPPLLELLQNHIPSLREKLTNAGVTVTELECLPGLPTAPASRLFTHLVDVRT